MNKGDTFMKIWNQPMLEELDLNATAYAPSKGTVVDGSYVSTDTQFTEYTYGPSGSDQPK